MMMEGQKVWSCELNSYGNVRDYQDLSKTDCPFRYQGQYEDAETGLYYNRFRYYSPDEGMYISQDPTLLNGGISLYSYVNDTNNWVDIFGLVGCDHTDNPKKKVNSADVDDILQTPDSHPENFTKNKRNYKNNETGEIWQKK